MKRKVLEPGEFTREQAESILLREVKRPVRKMNTTLIDQCVQILDEGDDGKQERLDQGWERLQAKLEAAQAGETRKASPRARRIPRMAMAIVCCLVIGGSIAQAVGFNLWDALVRAYDGTIEFYGRRNHLPGQGSARIGSGRGDELDRALEEHGFYVALPAWIPEGFSCETVNYTSSPQQDILVARYMNDDERVLLFSIGHVENDVTLNAFYEVNGDDVEIKNVDGIEYYIYNNMSRCGTFWKRDEYFVGFSGDVSMEDVEKMINSTWSEEE